MKRHLAALAACLCASLFSLAQSKIFKEVNDEIRSQVQPIRQDQSVVGYLALTQLEKASEDSFNYRITIMDENLNDIGKVEFRERNLDLQAVSFAQDVICLGYFRSIYGKKFKTKKEFEAAKRTSPNNVFLQFLTLEGKILKGQSLKTEVELETPYGWGNGVTVRLARRIQLTNLSQKGFACYFQDDANGKLNVFDAQGNPLWHKETAGKNEGDYVLASGDGVYVLSQKENAGQGGWEVKGYALSDGADYDKMLLKDGKGNSLSVTGWGNHPVTGKPFVSGLIINPKRGGVSTIKDVTGGPYFGVFTIDMEGHTRKEVKETYSYWNDKSQSAFSAKGRIEESKVYPYFDHSFKDVNGNTVFVGSSVKRKPRWGSIAASVVLSPTILAPLWIGGIVGFTKCKVSDNAVMLQKPTGELTIQESIPSNSDYTTYSRNAVPTKTLHRITNADTKTDYVVMDETKDVVIYNLTKKKVVRTIAHKDGNLQKGIIPAKDGHIMVLEYNKKERYTRVSIEQI